MTTIRSVQYIALSIERHQYIAPRFTGGLNVVNILLCVTGGRVGRRQAVGTHQEARTASLHFIAPALRHFNVSFVILFYRNNIYQK